jgi:hypothetical protein
MRERGSLTSTEEREADIEVMEKAAISDRQMLGY